MKTGIRIHLLFSIISSALLLALNTFGQDAAAGQTKKEKKALLQERVKAAVDAKTYDITVTSATGNKGRTINLTTAYGVKMTPEKFAVDLPYYGQSFQSAPYGGDGGVRFESKDFAYESKPGKKDGWDISIKPKDQEGIQNCFMTISKDGFVSINISFTNRTPMRYYGSMLQGNIQ